MNATNMISGYTLAIDPSAREHIVVVVKGTFSFPMEQGRECQLADQQVPLCLADEYWGKPGYSAPRYEADFSLRKQKCDILVNGSAYAPDRRPVERLRVGVKVGRWSKLLDVVGDRTWRDQVIKFGATAPQPFSSKPITYDVAFGGVDDLDPDEAAPDAFAANPVGKGWHRVRNQSRIPGAPLPNTENPDQPVRLPWGEYTPAGLGVVARGRPARLRFAGTYDQSWIDNVFPFLPGDFDDRYFQAAPSDQLIDFPAGGEDVTLVNLTPEGRVHFRLPASDMPVVFFRKGGGQDERVAVLDTILIEPDSHRLTLTWRASLPIRRDIFEIPSAVVGHMPRGWWRARSQGKTYFPSLDDMVRSRPQSTGAK